MGDAETGKRTGRRGRYVDASACRENASPDAHRVRALAAAGIKFGDYAESGNIGVESMNASLTRRCGHGLSDTGKASLKAALDDPNGSVRE
jgi:hypothetical protein